MATGYALFERVASEEIGQGVDAVQAAILDLEKFGKSVKLKSLLPFKSAAEALENCNDVSEGVSWVRVWTSHHEIHDHA